MKRFYFNFKYPNSSNDSVTILTGIKKYNNVYYITGIYLSTLPDVSFIYKGPLDGTGNFYQLQFSSTLPIIETNLFGPIDIDDNGIRVSGTCTLDNINKIRIACYYEGPLDNSGIWHTIIIPQEKITNTVAHSVVNNLVVGNYQIKNNQLDMTWESYIYDIKNDEYHYIIKENIKNIVSYGILKIDKYHFVICGSLIINNIEVAYTVNWNNKKKQLYDWKTYQFDNNTSVQVTRFNAISQLHNKYLLIGYYTLNNQTSGFMATIKNDTIIWESIDFPGAMTTRGNSIDDHLIVGIYNEQHAFISIK